MSDKGQAQVAPQILEAANALSRLTEKFTLACERAGGVPVFVDWLIQMRDQTPPVPFKVIAVEIEDSFGVHVSVGTLWDWMQRLGVEEYLREEADNG